MNIASAEKGGEAEIVVGGPIQCKSHMVKLGLLKSSSMRDKCNPITKSDRSVIPVAAQDIFAYASCDHPDGPAIGEMVP